MQLTRDEIEAAWHKAVKRCDKPGADYECAFAEEVIDAHTRKVLEDVEPVAFMFQHNATGRIAFVDTWQKNNGWATANPRYKEVGALHGASTVAALKAEIEALRKDAERYRWLRDGEIVADYPYPVMRMGGSRVDDQTIWADELDDAIDVALAAKGQA